MTTADPELVELVRRLREQDPAAVAELVRRYEPEIRRLARIRLARFSLRHLVDSEDIAQSVLGRFFARVQAGGLEFESPEKLLRLLSVIATNRVTSHARRERRHLRPTGQDGADTAAGLEQVPDTAPAIDRAAAARDQLDWVLRCLTPDNRELLLQRAAGRGWSELAAEKGVAADALRKRLARALDEAGVRLGMGDAVD